MPRNRRRSNQTTLIVHGKMVEVVSVTGLAHIIGKSRDTVLRYERKDVFPPAPILKGSYRYYPVSLARKLVPLVEKLPLHKKAEPELIAEINKLFNEERMKYAH